MKALSKLKYLTLHLHGRFGSKEGRIEGPGAYEENLVDAGCRYSALPSRRHVTIQASRLAEEGEWPFTNCRGPYQYRSIDIADARIVEDAHHSELDGL